MGGQRTLGLAMAETITGGIVSTTVTIVEHDAVLVSESDTKTAIILVPNGKWATNETFVATGGLLAGT